jgi:glycosyltransferase involved in cell wall biosynthesis
MAWPAAFPYPSPADLAVAEASLAACPDGAMVLIDGLAFGAMPELAATTAQRLRLVALVHHPLALESGLSPEIARRFRQSERRALAQAQAIIVTSRMTAATLRADYEIGDTPLTIAPPGICKPDIYRRPDNPVPHILCVGTIIPRKAHAVLIEALARIAALDWRCTIAGSLDRAPETVADLKRLISSYSMDYRITLTGDIDDLDPYYRAADLLVSASRYEGYGMAIAEAMAYGLPVVAANGGAIAEVVPPEAGVLVPVDDATALANAMRQLLNEPERRHAFARGALRVAARFAGWNDTAAKVASALDAVQQQ